MADFAALDELCAWMRSNGVTSARVGELSLTLDPALAPLASSEQPDPAPPAESPEERERRDLETLLLSSGVSDVTPFLTKRVA